MRAPARSCRWRQTRASAGSRRTGGSIFPPSQFSHISARAPHPKLLKAGWRLCRAGDPALVAAYGVAAVAGLQGDGGGLGPSTYLPDPARHVAFLDVGYKYCTFAVYRFEHAKVQRRLLYHPRVV